MRLNHLVLRNFRNYVDCEIDFTDGVNLFIGENAQGKTTLLEAIYFLSTAKSHRTYPDDELIRHNEDWFYLKGLIATPVDEVNWPANLSADSPVLLEANGAYHGAHLMTVEVSNELGSKKRFKLNGNLQKKLSQWIGQFKVVFFSPESLTLVKGAPADRRRFLDLLISQLSPTYLNHLQTYQFALKQRNELLRQIRSKQASAASLEPWNDLLVADGMAIIQARARVLAQLNVSAQVKHAALTGEGETLNLIYQPPFSLEETGGAAERFRRALESSQVADIFRGSTSVGPHRDDFTVILEARHAGAVQHQEARSFCSQGQQRTIALSLKLGELELIRQEASQTPIVLLDDVFSELDQKRSVFLFQLLQRLNTQIFMTSTRQEAWKPELGDCRVFTVQNGQVK